MARSDSSRPVAGSGDGRLDIETLIADLSWRFISLPNADVDREITDALRRIGESLDIDLLALWQPSSEIPGRLTATHYYSLEHGSQPPDSLQQDDYPWFVRQLAGGRPVIVPSVDDMPPDAARDQEACRRLGIKSNLTLPLFLGAEPAGVLGLNTTRTRRDWPDPLVTRLQLIGQMFAGALARRRADEEQRRSEARLAAAADLAGLGFYEVDFPARGSFFDARLFDICGTPPHRKTGLGPVEFWIEQLHPEDRPRVLEERERLHDGTVERLTIEYRYVHPTRGERWIDHRALVSRRDATRRAAHTFGALRDVTDARRAEEALRESYAQIERLKDRLEAESEYLKAEIGAGLAPEGITGQSAAIRRMLGQIEQVAPTPSSVLVLGETGTGKERVAQAIHRLSPRHRHVMVKVNCAALPSGLIESELFGREKGAFTGALARQVGRFEIADGSTLFLDEVGELPLDVQAKLLRVLESGEFERLGSPRTITVDVRVIAATNRDLRDAIGQGRFREDLYYRLNVFPIRVPPLRERPEDIPPLVWTLLEEFNTRMGKRITEVPRKTMSALQRYTWPGNVRELRNVLERAAIVAPGATLRLPTFDLGAAVEGSEPSMADIEREHILRVLERTGWTIQGPHGAARMLGLKRGTLYGRMRKLGIPLPRSKPSSS